MSARLLRYHTPDQAVAAIAGEPGRKYTLLVWIDAPVKVHKVLNTDVEKYGHEYPAYKGGVKRAARLMLFAGKSLGIKKSAKQFLKGAINPPTHEEVK